MEYVRSEHVQLTTTTPSAIGPSTVSTVQRIRSNSSGIDEETKHFFSLVEDGNVELVRKMLEQTRIEKSSLQSLLCHPLCDCKKCTALQEK